MAVKKKPAKKKPVKSKGAITKVEGGVIHKRDAINLLRALPDQSVDLAVFDPAYESLEKHRKTGTTTRLKKSKGSSNEWFETFPNAKYPELFRELHRVMKKGTFIYMFCDEETRDIVTVGFSPQYPEVNLVQEGHSGPQSPLLAAGFKFWKSIIWDKVHAGMGYHYRAQHELILLAEKVVRKGKHRKLNDLATGDVLKVKRLKGKDYYPTEKPMALMWKLIMQSTEPGDTVLDFFCGSGVVGQAARACGREFILGDIKPEEAIKRLK
jgi:site-specific DNA-methyltransferase (adenine-specific)